MGRRHKPYESMLRRLASLDSKRSKARKSRRNRDRLQRRINAGKRGTMGDD